MPTERNIQWGINVLLVEMGGSPYFSSFFSPPSSFFCPTLTATLCASRAPSLVSCFIPLSSSLFPYPKDFCLWLCIRLFNRKSGGPLLCAHFYVRFAFAPVLSSQIRLYEKLQTRFRYSKFDKSSISGLKRCIMMKKPQKNRIEKVIKVD